MTKIRFIIILEKNVCGTPMNQIRKLRYRESDVNLANLHIGSGQREVQLDAGICGTVQVEDAHQLPPLYIFKFLKRPIGDTGSSSQYKALV